MFSFIKSSIAALGLTGVLFASQLGAAPTASAHSAACDKCKTAVVQTAVTDAKGRFVRCTTTQKMVCPDCKNALANFFATGQFKHDCKTCDSMAMNCDSH